MILIYIVNKIGNQGAKVLGEALFYNNSLTQLNLTCIIYVDIYHCSIIGSLVIPLILSFTANNIDNDFSKELCKTTNNLQKKRMKERKQYQQAISLILLTYFQNSEISLFHLLPLEILYIIIRFVMNDMPAATIDIEFEGNRKYETSSCHQHYD